jgi:riboflavin biosynthesis pyrimidine reductase
MVSVRFDNYCRGKQAAAVAAVLPPYKTAAIDLQFGTFRAIGNNWSRTLFDGDFYRSTYVNLDIPVTNLVIVESLDGNTAADDPAILGGGATDKHLIYEGLSRVDADAVLSGATTARSDELVFSVWHPELVALRRELRRARHPAQVIVSSRRALHIETALIFQEPQIPVYLVTTSDAASSLRLQVAMRPWIQVIDAGQPLSMRTALRELRSRGIETVSAIGGRTTARALLREQVVHDLYLTTSPERGGEPDTPLLEQPLHAPAAVIKVGSGREAGVRFVHYAVGATVHDDAGASRGRS